MKSVLIVKLGALGDVVMATAMLPALRKQHPGIHITWMAGRGAAALLSLLDPPPQRIITVDERKLFSGSLISRIFEILKINLPLFGRKFDLCLVPYQNKRYHWLHWGALCSIIRDFSSPQALIPGKYHVQEYVRLALGTDDAQTAQAILFPNLALPPSSHTETAPAILLAPGGAKNILADDGLRRWPVQHYAALSKMLIAAGYRVGLIGSTDDAWTLPAFDGIPVISYVGATDLTQLLRLLKACHVLVTHDTGPMHLMRLLDGKLIALFGPTRSSEKLLPNSRRIVLESPPPRVPVSLAMTGRNTLHVPRTCV